jgi:YVTN family beta-propeller protein
MQIGRWVRGFVAPALLSGLVTLATLGCIAARGSTAEIADAGVRQEDPLVGLKLTGTLLVLNKRENTVSLIDLATGKTLRKVATGKNPNEVAVSPNGKRAVIANMGFGQQQPDNTYTILELPSGKIEKTVSLGQHGAPHGVLWLDNKRVLGTSHATDSVIEVDIDAGSVSRAIPTEQKGTHLVVTSPDQSKAWAVNAVSGSVTVIDLKVGKVLTQIPCEARAEGISISPDGKWIACGNVGANSVSLIDAGTNTVVRTVKDVAAPIRTLFTADGKSVMVSAAQGGEVVVFNASGGTIEKRIKLGEQKVKFELGGQPAPIPMNYTPHPGGRYVFVVMVASDAVAILDTQSWEVVAKVATGQLPDGMAYAPAPPTP